MTAGTLSVVSCSSCKMGGSATSTCTRTATHFLCRTWNACAGLPAHERRASPSSAISADLAHPRDARIAQNARAITRAARTTSASLMRWSEPRATLFSALSHSGGRARGAGRGVGGRTGQAGRRRRRVRGGGIARVPARASRRRGVRRAPRRRVCAVREPARRRRAGVTVDVIRASGGLVSGWRLVQGCGRQRSIGVEGSPLLLHRGRLPRVVVGGARLHPNAMASDGADPQAGVSTRHGDPSLLVDVARKWHEPISWSTGRIAQDTACSAPDQALNGRERVTGIEPALSAWEADVLPLNYTR